MELAIDEQSEDGQLRSPYNNNADDDDIGDNDRFVFIFENNLFILL